MKYTFALGLRGRLRLLLLVAFAMLAGLVAWDYEAHREQRLRAASTELLDHTRVIAAQARSFEAQADAVLNGLMLNPSLQPGNSDKACSQALAGALRQMSGFLQIGKALPDGDIACAALSPKGRVSIADRNFFKRAVLSHEMVVSEVLMARIVGERVIVLAKAMRNDAGHVTGVLYVSLDLAWLQRELASFDLKEGARLVVVDAKGTVAVRHPDSEEWIGKSAALLPLFRHILATGGEGALEEVGLEGERRLFAYAKLLDTVSGPTYLWLSVPKATIEAPAQRAALLASGILLAVLIGTLGLLIWGNNRLVLRPMLIMSRAAARLKAGDLDARTGLPHGDDELGRTARVLDEAATAIEDRERKLVRANRALRVLSAGNRALLRSKREPELLEEMCRAIVEAGGYRIAWVAYTENDPARRVRVVAGWGAEKDFLDGLDISWNESPSGRGPTGTAIRSGIPIVSNDVAADPDHAPWRELAQRQGFASVLALPLRLGDAVIGALCICAAEPHSFDDGVVELLSEAAADLSFGIAKHRAEVEHGRTRIALQSAEERFRAAADASLDALFILKSVRGERGQILDFEFTNINPPAERMLGMTHAQVIGQKLCELIPINRTGGFFDKYVAVVTTGAPLEEEFPIAAPQIKARWLRQQVVRVGDGIAISSRDITDRKQAEAALRASEKHFRDRLEQRVRERTAQLDEMNRQLESFSYSVSHDLRAPLRAIDGFSRALVEDHGERMDEEVRRYLDRIRASTLRMEELIDDLLELARISRVEVAWSAVDLSSMARQVLAELAQREPDREVEAIVHDDITTNGDPRLLRIVLENLLGNAWKFTRNAERPRVEFGVLRDGGGAAHFVRDNGAGFDMAHADKLFVAFQRLHAMNEFPGTGIGLSIVQRVVHKHRGRVWARAQPGNGATFYFTLGKDESRKHGASEAEEIPQETAS